MAKLEGGMYGKPLPEPAIALSSPEGRKIFREALVEGHAEAFFPLMEQFRTQDEPAFCGLATLVMVLNSLKVDPGRIWKGPWRWYDEQALDCCKPTEMVAKDGIELEEWLCLAQCEGLNVVFVRADEEAASRARFEEQCAASCAKPSGEVLVVSYSRKQVNQSGDGHYSPIGAYHRERSMALVLDTARFKYPPHWLPVTQLWEAMLMQNGETGRSRGYSLLSRKDAQLATSFVLKGSLRIRDAVRAWASTSLPTFSANSKSTAEEEMWEFARSLPPEVASLVSIAQHADDKSIQRLDKVLCALRRTRPYTALAKASADRPAATLPASTDALAMLVLVLHRVHVLGDALPMTQNDGLFGDASVGENGHREEAEALDAELRQLQEQATMVQGASGNGQSCCGHNGVNGTGSPKRCRTVSNQATSTQTDLPK